MLKSKRSTQHLKETASRQFTDREEPKKSYRKALQSIHEKEFNILVFYGVGGIGKSSLLKELFKLTDTLDKNVVKVTLDFFIEKHRDQSEALMWLRQQLKEQYKIKFTTFEMAYGIYWRKMNPQISLKNEYKEIPFLEEGSFIGEVIDQLENIPVAQWLPKTIKIINGLAQYREMIQWWNKTGKELLADLKDLHPKEIEDMLLVYWANDLKNWLKTVNKKVVFFFDTYEALWEKKRTVGSFVDKDEWIREFILQFENEPVLNVIFGREKLTWEKIDPDWENYVEQHLMGELSEHDCQSFLNSCHITDKEIQQTIIKGSEGLPYYLDLMVDTYQQIKRQEKIPKTSDFSQTSHEVLDRFLIYLDRTEQETLKVLSIPRFWTKNLFSELVTEFKTQFPVTAYPELCRFSFIQEDDSKTYATMHNLMKIGLHERVRNQSPSLLDDVHLFLFNYYTNKLNDESEVEKAICFVEGLFHGEFVLNEKELGNWIVSKAPILLNQGNWQPLIQTYQRILEYQESPYLHSLSHQELGILFTYKGQYELAEEHFLKAISLIQKGRINGLDEYENDKRTAKVFHRLGKLYGHTNQYKKSIESFTNALKELKNCKPDDVEGIEERAFVYIRLGKMMKLQSEYELAQQYYEQALLECETAISMGHHSANIYSNLGEANEKLGELLIDEKDHAVENLAALNYLNASISAYDRALMDAKISKYIPVLAHKGLAYKRKAEYFSTNKHPEEKLTSFQKAIEIYNEVISLAPDYVDGYEMRGHAAIDLMDVYIELGDFEKGIELFKLGVDSFEYVLELTEKQGSSRNRISSAYRSLGRLYRKQKNYSLAIEALEKAVEKSDLLLKYSPEYIYGYNTRGGIFRELGNCYVDMQDTIKAVDCYKEALSCFEKTLSKTPHSKSAILSKEKISQLIRQLEQ